MQPWHYFLSLEADFVETLNYVELDPINSQTFSNEYLKLLLLLGSEIDVTAKMICKSVDPAAKRANIDNYRDIITTRFPKLCAYEVGIERDGSASKPWATWDASPKTNPIWWSSYNDVKHERNVNFKDANQENVLGALSGLLVLLIYHYHLYDPRIHIQPYPNLLDKGFPSSIVTEGSNRPKDL